MTAKRTRAVRTTDTPTVVAIVSDLHCGSTIGLAPPVVQLDDGGRYEYSPAQAWLWENYADFWQRVQDKRTRLKAKLLTVFNGDLVDGNHHGTTQILSGNPNAQAAAVNACMAIPLALKPDSLLFIRGTDAHVGQSASAEERIADGLKRDKRPVLVDAVRGTASHWHFRGEIQGVRFDFAHHGRVGTRPWTKPNVTANLAAEIFYDHAANNIPHPHLAIRSHMHQWVDTGSVHPVRVLQTPGWQLATSFIHRIAAGSLADIGGVIVTVDRGEYEVQPVRYRPDPNPIVSL